MIRKLFIVVLLVAGGGSSAAAQSVPSWELSTRISSVRSELVGGNGCCFWMSGGTGSIAWNSTNWFAIATEGSGYRTGQVERTGKDLFLLTYLAGPRISYRKRKGFTLFGQGLLGVGQVRGSLFQPSASGGGFNTGPAFALSTGGGVDYDLKPSLCIRLLQADLLYTALRNGTNNRESSLSLSAGIVFRFGKMQTP
jgi:hypothetical protein